MSTIPLTLRLVKGSKLTFGELDQNFINLRNAINSVSASDTFVTGGTYNNLTDTITLDRNDGVNINITGVTDTFITGGTFNPSTIALDFNGNIGFNPFSVDVTPLLDTYVNSGSYNASTGCVTFTTTSGYSFSVCGFITGFTDTFVTGGTLSGNNLILDYGVGGSTSPIDLSPLVFTGNTSGDCISNIFVSNIHSCSPLNINPNDEGDVYFGSTSGITVDVTNNRLGVNTSSPTQKVHVDEGILRIENSDPDLSTINSVRENGIRLDAGSTSNYAEIRPYNGLNNTRIGLSFWTSNPTPTEVVRIQPNGNVGIGTNTPSEKLEVDGNTIINGTLTLPAGTTTDPSLILTDGGTLLTSPQIGAFEFLGTSLYFTDFTGVRRNILLAQSGFTATTVNELQDTEVSTVSNGETWYYDGGLWRNTNIISIDNNNVKATIDGDLDVSGNTIINGSLNIGTILSGTPIINLGLDSSGNVVTGISSIDFYVTGGTLNNNSIEINRNDSSNIFTISGTSGININEPATGIFTIESTGGGGGGGTTQATGLTISFTSKEVYNTPTSPGTGNISDDLTGSQLGIVQKIYHNSGSVPTVPAGWVLLGDGIYFTNQLNIIYAEWVTGSRVEYWIVQEQ